METMKKAFLLSIILGGFVSTTSVLGQQLGLSTLYNQNIYLINPAAAGFDDCIAVNLNHRNQWTGIDGSPKINTFVVDNRIGKNHGVGLDLRNLRSGLINNFNLKGTYAYHLKLTENSFLSGGISLGIIQQKFLADQAIASDYTDDLLTNGVQSDVGFTSDIGLMYHWDKLTIGLAVPQIIAAGLIVDYGETSNKYRLVDHMNFYVSYDVYDEDNWSITPSILYRNSDYSVHQIDLAVNAMWNNFFGFGLMYRSTYGLSGMIEFNFLEDYRFGYSYEFGSSNITGVSTGTHEIMIGMKICD
jgi:type IX secretion system PorP/SprF family membrane protein